MSGSLDISPVSVIENESDLDVPYNVFLWNDPVTLMPMVVRALKKVFSYSTEKAEQLMLEAHKQDKTVVWTGEADKAQSFCIKLHTYGLQATVGKDA